jgi:hypothetical protein
MAIVADLIDLGSHIVLHPLDSLVFVARLEIVQVFFLFFVAALAAVLAMQGVARIINALATRRLVPYATFWLNANADDALYFTGKANFLCFAASVLRLVFQKDETVPFAVFLWVLVLVAMAATDDTRWAGTHYPRLGKRAPLYNSKASEMLALNLIVVAYLEVLERLWAFDGRLFFAALAAWWIWFLAMEGACGELYQRAERGNYAGLLQDQKVHGYVPPVTAERLNEALGGNAPLPRQGERRMPSPTQTKFYD